VVWEVRRRRRASRAAVAAREAQLSDVAIAAGLRQQPAAG
jgi:hypothetical protein